MRDKLLKDRYLLNGETEHSMYKRVVKAVMGKDDQTIVGYMDDGIFLPNSPTLVNAGTNKGGLSACYVVPIEDSLEGIYKTVHDAAIIHKYYGGTGFNFSNIRPEGSLIVGTGGKACGPIKVMQLLNQSAETVNQGGKRQGANMGILDVSHPDIEKFITCKDQDGVLTHFNLSVGMRDDMIKDDIVGTIADHAWKTGDPGIIFMDRLNERNRDLDYGVIEATNPCLHGSTLIQTVEGEIPIEQLVGREIDVYCMDESTYTLKISHAYNVIQTKIVNEFIKIHTTRRDVICTPDHLVFTRNRGWVQAQELKTTDSIVGLNKFPRNERHVMVMLSGRDRSTAVPEHRLIAEYYYEISPSDVVHHVNGISTDNRASNLIVVSRSEHSKYHNVGHPCYAMKDSETGKFVSGSNKLSVSNALHHNPVGVNLRILSIERIQQTDAVYDLTVDTYHNCIANGIVVHNCGEQPLLPYECCNLGSINLSSFVENGTFNEYAFGKVVNDAVRFLDSVIDVNNYPLHEIEVATKRTRKIGLGIMGWHDCLIKLGIPYCSDDALVTIDKIGKCLKESAWKASEDLAVQFGPYREGIDVRNATVTTIAPTGTLSYLAGCSSGIEPVYQWVHTRTSEVGTTKISHPLYEKFVKGSDLERETALMIPWEWHIKHQAQWQKWIDNAVSKTINMSKNVTVDDIYDAYMFAWKTRCKGITVYRDGSKMNQVLMTDPISFSGDTIGIRKKLHSGCGDIRVECDGKVETPAIPYEVVVLTSGGCKANNEGIGRLISTYIHDERLVGGEIETVKNIVHTLSKVECSTAMKNPKSDGKSCPHIIGKVMRNVWLTDKTEVGRVCPECGGVLEFGEGCGTGTCKYCGWSGCS